VGRKRLCRVFKKRRSPPIFLESNSAAQYRILGSARGAKVAFPRVGDRTEADYCLVSGGGSNGQAADHSGTYPA
jgi:hypothetical protein